MTTEESIIQIIEFQGVFNEGVVTSNSNLRDDLGLDELDYLELTMELEDAFGIRIEDATAENWTTVQDIIDFIKKHKR